MAKEAAFISLASSICPMEMVNLHLLLVEDDETSRIIVMEVSRRRGWKVTQAVNGREEVALSGDREMCLKAGMDDYLSKPIDTDAFCDMVERWTNTDSSG